MLIFAENYSYDDPLNIVFCVVAIIARKANMIRGTY